MAKKNYKRLGERELEILNTVWELGEASVSDVRAILLTRGPIAYTSVMTTMRKLADKGYLSFSEDEKQYIYKPQKSRSEVRMGLLSDLISSAFKGSPLSLVQTLVREADLSDQEMREIKKVIDQLDQPEDV